MSQAIITKFIGPTNTKGSRYKASCDRGSIIVESDHALNSEQNHVAAAQALVNRFLKQDAERYGTHVNPWSQPRVHGGLPSGELAHVFTDSDCRHALESLVRLCLAHRWKANSEEFDAITHAVECLKHST